MENKEKDQETKTDIFYDNQEAIVPSAVVTIQPAPKPKIPARKMPVMEFGVKKADLEKARKAHGIPEASGYTVSQTDQAAFDEAYARLARHDARDKSVKVGMELVLDISLRDTLGADKVEVALLAIHGFEIEKAMADFDEKIKSETNTELKKVCVNVIRELSADFIHLVNVTHLVGSKAGLALQAMKLVANRVYSVDAMLRKVSRLKRHEGKFEPLTRRQKEATIKQSADILKFFDSLIKNTDTEINFNARNYRDIKRQFKKLTRCKIYLSESSIRGCYLWSCIWLVITLFFSWRLGWFPFLSGINILAENNKIQALGAFILNHFILDFIFQIIPLCISLFYLYAGINSRYNEKVADASYIITISIVSIIGIALSAYYLTYA